MAGRRKKRLRGAELSGLRPDWRPLIDLAPDEVPDFMWMFRDFLEDGTVVEAYKHSWTRRYLHLDSAGRAYEYIGGVGGASYEEVDPEDLLATALRGCQSRAGIVRQNAWVDGKKIGWARSATRHRVPRAQALFAIQHAGICFEGGVGAKGQPRLYFFGDDGDERPLEVAAIVLGGRTPARHPLDAVARSVRGAIHGGVEMEDVSVTEFRTASGEILTEDDVEKIADEIESDAPVVFTGIRPVGRPSLDGNGSSPRLSFRVPRELYDAAAERAIAEERTVSAVAREALEKYLG